MPVLSDVTIEASIKSKQIVIRPYNPDNLQPASVDLTLCPTFKFFDRELLGAGRIIDPRKPVVDLMCEVTMDEDDAFILAPGAFALGSTNEWVRIPANVVGRLEGKSSLARLGLSVHSTAGFFDPGFEGTCTLEFKNDSPLPILLVPHMKVCQMSFMRMTTIARNLYGDKKVGSKYQGQEGPTASRMHENWSDERPAFDRSGTGRPNPGVPENRHASPPPPPDPEPHGKWRK